MDPSDRYPDEHQKRMFFLLMSHPIAQKIHKNSLTTSRVIGKISRIPYRIALVKIPFKNSLYPPRHPECQITTEI